MMGADGLRAATETAILSANYIAARLAEHYEIHFSGEVEGVRAAASRTMHPRPAAAAEDQRHRRETW